MELICLYEVWIVKRIPAVTHKMQHILLNLLKEKISWHIYLTVSSFFGWNEVTGSFVARKWRTWLRAVDTHYPDPMTMTKVYQACVQNVDILLPRVSDCRKEFQTRMLLSSNPYLLCLPCILSSNCLSPQLYVNKWYSSRSEHVWCYPIHCSFNKHNGLLTTKKVLVMLPSHTFKPSLFCWKKEIECFDDVHVTSVLV